jgi:hypothetical protein
VIDMQRHMIAVRHCATNLAKLQGMDEHFRWGIEDEKCSYTLNPSPFISSLNFIYYVTIYVPAILDYRISTVDGL